MELKQILEAIVFSAQKPMSIGELRTLLRETPEKLPDETQTGEYAKATARAVEKALEELAVEHDAVDRSYRLACVGGNWQFVTKPDFAPWLQVLVGAKPRPPKLSHPALETLAIIAYRQPITRPEMEQIRGVTVDGVVQTLVERELIEVCGEADAPGRPRLYGTTQFFLEHFGLKGLGELPAADELRRIQVELATVPADDSQEELPLDKKADEADDDPDETDDEDDEKPLMSLEEYRKAIDAIDKKLVRLLNERTGHALAIGTIKLEAGEEIYAPHRERLIFQRLAKLNEGPIPEESMRAIYREIMSCSLSLEKSLTVAYLGPEATYTHQAAIRKFGSSLRYTPQKTIKDVFDEVQKDRADYGVVPIENSTEGVVTHTLDLFVDSPLKIVAQIVMPIQHCLVRSNRRTKVRRLYSHPQALAQCRVWMQQNLPSVEVIEASSTTRAAEKAAEDKAGAAIAGSLAAERYNLEIVDHHIQDNAANATRFFVLGRKCSPSTKNDRTSLVIGIEDKVGALHEVMGPFRKYRLNMTRIESRPSKRKAWEYLFFIDCDGHYGDKKVANAIEELERISRFVKILGSYPNGK